MKKNILVDSLDRMWSYYKCENCGHSDRFLNNNYHKPQKCSHCGKMMEFNYGVEEAWLNEVDEKGRLKRMDFSGRTEDECLANAATFYGCKSGELDYYIVQRGGSFKKFVINAERPVKYSHKDGDVTILMWEWKGAPRWWCVINPTDKSIIYPEKLGKKRVHFDDINSIEHIPSSLASTTYAVDFVPQGKVEFMFMPGYENGISILFNVLKEFLNDKNDGVISVEYKTKIEMSILDSSKKSPLDFRYRDIKVNDICAFWKTETDLCFWALTGYKLFRIPLDEIKYYRLIGQKYYTSEVAGGGGGGSSLKGAVVGGVIAGGAGAVIGSRKEIDEVHSSDRVHDEQEVLLYLKNDDQVARMNSSVYDLFIDMIPDKDYDIVSTEKPVEVSGGNNDLEMLKRLADLYDKGILTEEEFNEKKKEILSRI